MNVLIVDDDAFVVEALQKTMKWTEMGIKDVYTAYGVQQAKKVIETMSVHIILCDIEMPKENGLELLKWVREKDFPIQNIFLTSHAEFEYAKEAISLGSFDYILKPIAYDKLAKQIKKAMAYVEKELKKVEYRRGYDYWIETIKNRKEQFWRKLILDRDLMTMPEINKYLGSMDLEYVIDDHFLGVVVQVFNYEEAFEKLGRGMVDFTSRNIAEELFQRKEICVEGVLKVGKGTWFLVLQVQDRSAVVEVAHACDELIEKVMKYFNSGVHCGIGNICTINHLAENYQHILKMSSDNVLRERKTVHLNTFEYKDIVYQAPNLTLWENFLVDGKEKELYLALEEYLAEIVSTNQVNKEVLYQLMMDVTQMIFVVLKEKHILLHDWQYERFNSNEITNAIVSVKNIKLYLENMITETIEAFANPYEPESIIDVLKNHINDYIGEEITRESLAKIVHLNPDYLARIFKNETGNSIGNYLITKRIEMAKAYLKKTDDPISIIATKVGYDNFSYFSKIFKNAVGISPTKYRHEKQCKHYK